MAGLCAGGGPIDLGLLAFCTCAMSWAAAPLVAALAMRTGAFVEPGGRSVHTARTPLLGGLAIYPAIAYALLRAGGPHAGALIAGGAVVLVAGAVDDLRGLTPKWKIAAQVAAGVVLVAGGYRITGLRVDPVGTVAIDGFEGLAVVAWIVLVTNAVNLIDGVDGLAGTLALVAALAHAALGAEPALAVGLAGACLGFLRHNLPRARIFLGDTGSLLVGFYLGALALGGARPLNLPVAVGLLLIPLGDVAMCVVRRWLRAKPLFAADRGHIHHALLRLWGDSPVRVLVGLGTLATAQAAVIWAQPNLWGLLAAGCLWGGGMVYVVCHVRPDWLRIVVHRHAFRRIHVARNYARGALELCESPEDVRAVLHRVVQDLGLCALEIGGIRIERRPPPILQGAVVGERVDCGDASASWTAVLDDDDRALAEEKRAVMCEVLRLAGRRLRCCATGEPAWKGRGGAGGTTPEPGVGAVVHWIVRDLPQLRWVASLVPGARKAGASRAIIVYLGPRGDLARQGSRPGDLGVASPVICLDVPPEPDAALVARVRTRYEEMVHRDRPAAAVVVGNGAVASGCARAAYACGIGVVQIEQPTALVESEPAQPGQRIDLGARAGGLGRNGAAGAVPQPAGGPHDNGARPVPALGSAPVATAAEPGCGMPDLDRAAAAARRPPEQQGTWRDGRGLRAPESLRESTRASPSSEAANPAGRE